MLSELGWLEIQFSPIFTVQLSQLTIVVVHHLHSGMPKGCDSIKKLT